MNEESFWEFRNKIKEEGKEKRTQSTPRLELGNRFGDSQGTGNRSRWITIKV